MKTIILDSRDYADNVEYTAAISRTAELYTVDGRKAKQVMEGVVPNDDETPTQLVMRFYDSDTLLGKAVLDIVGTGADLYSIHTFTFEETV